MSKVTISENVIERVKNETNICDTFCCYDDCEQCVEKFLKYLTQE